MVSASRMRGTGPPSSGHRSLGLGSGVGIIPSSGPISGGEGKQTWGQPNLTSPYGETNGLLRPGTRMEKPQGIRRLLRTPKGRRARRGPAPPGPLGSGTGTRQRPEDRLPWKARKRP